MLADHPVAAPEVDVVDLVIRASQSAVAAGLVHRALSLPQQHLASLPDQAPAEHRVLLLHAMASAALLLDDAVDVFGLTTQAMQLLPPAADPLRARVLAAHALAGAWRGRDDEARGWAEQAAALARQLELPAVLADATTTLARLSSHDPTDRVEAALRAGIAEARAAGDAATELRSSHNLGTVLYERGRLADAQQAYQQAAARAVELRRPWAPYGLDGRAMAAVVGYVRGEWETVLRLVDATGESPPPLAGATLGAVALAVAAGRGEVAALDVLARIPRCATGWRSTPPTASPRHGSVSTSSDRGTRRTGCP